MKLLENNIGLVLSSIEWPSTIKNEKQSIQDYVDQVTEYFPDGVSATEVMENLPDELPYSTQLKTLIELAKQKLLTLGATDYKPSPMEVLKIYGNPKHTAEKTQFNMNELEVNNPINIKDEILKYLKKALDKVDQFIENNPGHNKLSNLEYYQGVLHEIIYGLEDPELVLEAKYQGRTVQLNKPSKGDIKKFKVYVKNPKTGKIVKINFGDKNLKIKKK